MTQTTTAPSEQVPPDQIDAVEILLAAAAAEIVMRYLQTTPTSLLVAEGYFGDGGAWEMAGINEWRKLVKPLEALTESALKVLVRRVSKAVLSAVFPGWSSAKADQKADQVAASATSKAIGSMAKSVYKAADTGSLLPSSADRIAIATTTEAINRAVIETLEGVKVVVDADGVQVPADPGESGGEIKVTKTWRTKRDSRVRPSHGGLEGEQVQYDDRFRTFTGHNLRFPGDPTAPISETANCRCRLSLSVDTGNPPRRQRSGATLRVA